MQPSAPLRYDLRVSPRRAPPAPFPRRPRNGESTGRPRETATSSARRHPSVVLSIIPVRGIKAWKRCGRKAERDAGVEKCDQRLGGSVQPHDLQRKLVDVQPPPFRGNAPRPRGGKGTHAHSEARGFLPRGNRRLRMGTQASPGNSVRRQTADPTAYRRIHGETADLGAPRGVRGNSRTRTERRPRAPGSTHAAWPVAGAPDGRPAASPEHRPRHLHPPPAHRGDRPPGDREPPDPAHRRPLVRRTARRGSRGTSVRRVHRLAGHASRRRALAGR
jgi:hypothetical protein